MNKRCIIWLFLWILSLVGISYYGGAVSYIFCYTMTMIPVISLVYLLCVFIRLRVLQKLSTINITAGAPFPYYFILENHNFFTFTNIRLNFFKSFSTIKGFENKEKYELLPFSNIKKETTILCKYRGTYSIGIKSIEMTDFFGLFTFKYSPKEIVRVSVAPAIHHLSDINTLNIDTIIPKETYSEKTIPDITVRDYEPFDDIRNINWKATAKTNQLKTKKMIGEDKNCINILIDTLRFENTEEEYLPVENKILEIAIAISLFIAGKNIPSNVLYFSNGLEISSLNTLNNFNDFYKKLSAIEFSQNNSFEKLMNNSLSYIRNTSSQIIILILKNIDKKIYEFCQKMSNEDIQTIIYLIGKKEPENNKYIEGLRITIIHVPIDTSLEEVL